MTFGCYWSRVQRVRNFWICDCGSEAKTQFTRAVSKRKIVNLSSILYNHQNFSRLNSNFSLFSKESMLFTYFDKGPGKFDFDREFRALLHFPFGLGVLAEPSSRCPTLLAYDTSGNGWPLSLQSLGAIQLFQLIYAVGISPCWGGAARLRWVSLPPNSHPVNHSSRGFATLYIHKYAGVGG